MTEARRRGRYATQGSNPRQQTPGRSATHTCEPRLGQWVCTKAHAKRLVELLHDTDATVELLHLRNSWVGYAVADWLGGALIACMLLGGWATAASEAVFSSCLLLPVLPLVG